MVLYHRGIPCVVLVDLKIGRLAAQDIGQMNKYLGYWRRHKQYAHEQPAIGLIICREAGREEVIYALDAWKRSSLSPDTRSNCPRRPKSRKPSKTFNLLKFRSYLNLSEPKFLHIRPLTRSVFRELPLNWYLCCFPL